MVDIAGPNESPDYPLGDGGSTLLDWRSASTERIGPDDGFEPPTRGRLVAEEWFACGAFITGRRTFDIANGLSG
jgi:hypothetical protein